MNNELENIIQTLRNMDIDGETTQYILEQIGMDEQMAIQLTTKYPNMVEEHLHELKSEGLIQNNTNTDNTYLIFPDAGDVNSYCKIECERNNFVDSLIEANLITDWDDMRLLDWMIFEKGELRSCSDFI
jgi:hypothetical protein